MIASRSVMSARSKWVTWGISVAESVMRSAMVRRRCESGARSTGPHCSKRGSGGASRPTRGQRLGRARRRGGPRGAAPARRCACGPAAAARTSSSATRPPGPVPRTAREIHAQLAGQPPRGRGRGHRAFGASGTERGASGGARPRAGAAAGGRVGRGRRRCRRAPAGRRRGGRRRRRIARSVTSTAPTFTVWPGCDVDLLHAPAHGRGDLDLRLVGLDLEERARPRG